MNDYGFERQSLYDNVQLYYKLFPYDIVWHDNVVFKSLSFKDIVVLKNPYKNKTLSGWNEHCRINPTMFVRAYKTLSDLYDNV